MTVRVDDFSMEVPCMDTLFQKILYFKVEINSMLELQFENLHLKIFHLVHKITYKNFPLIHSISQVPSSIPIFCLK